MKIAIIGATGMIGSAIYKEAASREIEITAFVRDEDKAKEVLGDNPKYILKGIGNLLTDDLKEFDVIINAFADRTDFEKMFTVYKLLSLYAKQQNAKLIQLVGASSMMMSDGRTLYEHQIEKLGEQEWMGEVRVGMEILDDLRNEEDLNWVAVSPDIDIYSGEKTKYKIIGSEVEYSKDKKAQVSTGNYAAAIIDELIKPTVKNDRFSVMDI